MSDLLDGNPSSSTGQDEFHEGLQEEEENHSMEMPDETAFPTKYDVAVQTEWSSITMVDSSTQCEMPTTCNAQCQFPHDVCEAVFADHTFCCKTAPEPVMIEEMDDNASQGSQLDLVPDLTEGDSNEGENAADEPMEVVISQETASSQSEYEPSEDGSCSQGEALDAKNKQLETVLANSVSSLFMSKNCRNYCAPALNVVH